VEGRRRGRQGGSRGEKGREERKEREVRAERRCCHRRNPSVRYTWACEEPGDCKAWRSEEVN